MTTTASVPARSATAARPGRLRAVLLIAAAAVIAIVANTIVAAVAVAAGADPAFPALGPSAIVPASIVGVAVAAVGWYLVVRLSARPARLLRVLVPVLAVLSFTPDLALALTGFIPGAGPTEVVALMVMHLVVVAVAVPTLIRAVPPRSA